MKDLKKLETKLQTIFMDDYFEITEEDVLRKIELKLESIMSKMSDFNSAIYAIEGVKDEYVFKFKDSRDGLLLEDECIEVEDLLEDEITLERMMMADFIEEVLTNQELYEYIKTIAPNLVKLINKINECNCHDVDDIVELFVTEFDSVCIEDLKDKKIYDYLNELFLSFSNLLQPTNVEDKDFVKDSDEINENEEEK